MIFINLPLSVSSLAMSAGSLISAHPGLINELATHALSHTLYSHIRRGVGRGVGRVVLSRAQRRRTANRRRRWFVDNIIMHHKRLHDKNREIAISNVRNRLIEKRAALKKQPLSKPTPQNEATKWRDKTSDKDRGLSIRGRIDARRMRARSRWLSVADVKKAEDS